MKITTLVLSVMLLSATVLFAQSVGINSDGSSPDASAMLDVQSTTKGFLAPRMTQAQREAIIWTNGLLVFQTDTPIGYYYLDQVNESWKKIASTTDIQWTTSGSDIYYNSGNVGIGTTSPLQKLDVVGNGRFYNESGISKMTIQTNSATDQASVDLLNSTLSARWILDANDLFRVYNQTSGFDAFVVKASGNVGIGTTSPGGKLHIADFGYGIVTGISMNPVNDTEGGHYITFHDAGGTGIGSIARGAGNTVVYNTSSDYRLKENVVNISANQAITRLMALRPVEYNYISDENKTVISGFLAHEMADAGFANGVTGEKDAVDKDGKPIYQAIDTKFLIPEMVKVIQEQQIEIDGLKAELQAIKSMLEQTEKR
ncbi:MAG: tail fiber domain-containing protein [Melioribacteraceae bacterium]|nr:tail fiber domain-containing protein [Melioribacteraceae bacterium]